MTRWFRRHQVERELDDEVQFHVEAQIRDLIAEGVPPAEARRRALAAFGGIEPIKERAREVRPTRWLEDGWADLRYAARAMWRQKTFTAAAALSLAVGIGANTAVFSVVNALLLRPLPIAKPSEVYFVSRTRPAAPGRSASTVTKMSYPAFERYRVALASQHVQLAPMSVITRMQLSVPSSQADAELITGQVVGGEWFSLLGIAPAAGRLLTPADDVELDGHPVAVISDGYWTRRFSRSPSAIGSTIRLNGGVPLTIVGVAARHFTGFVVGESADVWVPTSMQQGARYLSNGDNDGGDATKPWRTQDLISWLTLVARVPPATDPTAAEAALKAAFRHDMEARAATYRSAASREYALQESVVLDPGGQGMSDVRKQYGRAVLVLMVTVAIVLLLACANLTHLLLARHASRAREFGVRLSLGAGRGRLARQLFTESLALAALSGAASVLLAAAGARILLRLASDDGSPMPLDIQVDPAMIGFAAVASFAAALFVGLLPAFRCSRGDAALAMKTGGRTLGPTATSTLPIGRVLMAGQVALAVVLLVGAGLFVQTLRHLLRADSGLAMSHVVTARFDPSLAGYGPSELPALRERLMLDLQTIPGMESSAASMCGPLANCGRFSSIRVNDGVTRRGEDDDIQEDFITPAYFDTLGMGLLRGRRFLPSDVEGAQPVAIVSRAMARHFFGGTDPLGKQFEKGGTTYHIVGVVNDSRVNGLRAAPPPMVFYPFSQNPEERVRNLYVRTTARQDVVASALQSVIRNADRGIAIREIVALSDLGNRSLTRERLVASLTSAFGVLAIAVACLGLYGSVSYSVARRTTEIGVRLALGARLGHVRWIVVREPFVLLIVGGLTGVALAWPALRLAANLLEGVSPHDPATFLGAWLVIIVVGLVAAAIPAWRASRLNPLIALKSE